MPKKAVLAALVSTSMMPAFEVLVRADEPDARDPLTKCFVKS
jgi:hypothetical protein